MSDYFEKTKKASWNMLDAYRKYEEANKNLSTQQKLNQFYDFLKRQNYPEIESWLKNWSSFYNKVINPKGSESTNSKAFIDFSHSTNTVGTINQWNKRENVYCNSTSQKKTRYTDEALHEEVVQEENEEENDDDEPEPRSDLSNDYHPARTLGYILEESTEEESDIFDNVEASTAMTIHKDKWLVEDFNVTDQLQKFKDASFKISPRKLSDLRLLAANSIYLFSLESSDSITNYIDVYDVNDLDGERAKKILSAIKDDLNISEGQIVLNTNIIIWANELAEKSIEIKDWFEIQDITIPFMVAANKNRDKLELVAANILHKLALNFSNKQPEHKLEDSFVHNFISAIFDSIFQSDPLLSYQWANGFLSGSSHFKPDFVVFVKHSMDRYDIAVSEVKPPLNSKSCNAGESDLLKIGKEMVWMLNTLVKEGVEDPVVCGVLFKGLQMTTFKMDLQYPQVYRLVELSVIKIFDNLQQVSLLPSILRNVLQVKNIAKKTAIKAKKRALSKSTGEAFVHSPPLYFTVNSTYKLRRTQKKQK